VCRTEGGVKEGTVPSELIWSPIVDKIEDGKRRRMHVGKVMSTGLPG
jgi:hypothetical protein